MGSCNSAPTRKAATLPTHMSIQPCGVRSETSNSHDCPPSETENTVLCCNKHSDTAYSPNYFIPSFQQKPLQGTGYLESGSHTQETRFCFLLFFFPLEIAVLSIKPSESISALQVLTSPLRKIQLQFHARRKLWKRIFVKNFVQYEFSFHNTLYSHDVLFLFL